MDTAVALVQGYLQVNGYFTITEYPVVEAVESGYRTVTDIDILAVRFPMTGFLVAGEEGPERFEADPVLDVSTDRSDLLIGEVKEGRAELNQGALNADVLRVALRRFGCCDSAEISRTVTELLKHGQARMAGNYQVRLVAFGTMPPGRSDPLYQVILLNHIAEYLQDYIKRHWDIIRHAQIKGFAGGFLTLLEKARVGAQEAAKIISPDNSGQ